MQNAIAVDAGKLLYNGELTRTQCSFVNKTPVSFVEVECLLTGDRIMWIAVPRDQAELGKIPYDKSKGSGFHGVSMHDAGGIFKPHGMEHD
jgi:hypothetical protein